MSYRSFLLEPPHKRTQMITWAENREEGANAIYPPGATPLRLTKGLTWGGLQRREEDFLPGNWRSTHSDSGNAMARGLATIVWPMTNGEAHGNSRVKQVQTLESCIL